MVLDQLIVLVVISIVDDFMLMMLARYASTSITQLLDLETHSFAFHLTVQYVS